MKIIQCHSCQCSWNFEPPLSRSDCCPECLIDAKVCRNCHFFAESSSRNCNEPQAEWVKEKLRGNFCSYFIPASINMANSDVKDHNAMSDLEALFGNEIDRETESVSSNLEQELQDHLAKMRK